MMNERRVNMEGHQEAPFGENSDYVQPEVKTYTSQELEERVGPALTGSEF